MRVCPLFGIFSKAAVVFFCGCSGARATDLDLLARLLVPAYLAQNFAAVCISQDPKFPSDLFENGIVSINAFSEHVKVEVTAGLSEPIAAEVRVKAADAARLVVRGEIDLLRGNQAKVPPEALQRWCERSVKPFIFEVTSKHQEKHGEIERLLESAKK